MGHARLRPDAFGDQPVGDAARGAVELGVAGGAAGMDEGGGVGTLRRMLTHDVCQPRHLDTHRTLPLAVLALPERAAGVGILRLFWSDFKGLIA